VPTPCPVSNGVFRERAERIEQQLPRWGQDLYHSALDVVAAQPARVAWQSVAATSARRFSVEVDTEPPEGASEDARNRALEAGTGLLALPWELLRDEQDWLFQGAQAVRVRRRLPSRHAEPARSIGLPIRILLVSPRPEDDAAGYIDHRISARPLVMALESLGELAELTVLPTPTQAGLEAALLEAAHRGQPFDVVHFDGHGVYDPKLGLGGLCFEHPEDLGKLENRRHELVDAEHLADIFRAHRVPLVFLEACQSAQSELDPSASVAAKLLEQGVASVVAMSHSVLVETAHRFVEAFYKELTQGSRVGEAMLTGQRALYANTARGKIMGAGELHLHDWFVPVIYQEQQDPQLITQLAPEAVQHLRAKQRQRQFGALKPPPPHQFIGRSRELLAFERLLATEPWASVRGVGGTGKTTLACELARWLGGVPSNCWIISIT